MNHARATNPTFQIKIGDLELTASKLDLNKIGQIEEWAQGQVMALARRGIQASPDMPSDERQMIYQIAMDKASKLSFTDVDGGADELNSKISSLPGLQYVLWVCCVEHDPELTPDQIGSAALTDEMIAEVNAILTKSGVHSEESEALSASAGGTKSPGRARRKKVRKKTKKRSR